MPSFSDHAGVSIRSQRQANNDGPGTQNSSISYNISTSNGPDAAEPIAIVGMAMRLPGRVHNGDDFWQLMVEKRNGLCEVPQDRYNIAGFYDPSGKPGTFRMNKGYFLQDVDIQQFDTSFFSISKAELERLDPQQRQLLEVTYECMEDAGAISWRGTNIGCYVGVFGDDWQDLNAKETQQSGGYRVTGYDDFVLGNRVSYEFDLHGPSMTVKTGCSSSLVCLDMACEAIRKGDCDGALVCGSGLIFSPTMTLALSDQGVLSPSGVCRTFDASANGYGRGEAVNAIYIKRLSDAIRDCDLIRAVIRGTSVNCDGRTQAMLTPCPKAQEALIRRAYWQAGIQDLSETAIVECHGTGTRVGDPLETTAVANCFGDKGMIITSVKPNVGHSEGAAGLTSLIKAVLAIEHRQVPPNIFFQTPNPDIPFERYNLRVPTETESWPEGRAERVSVNSFGIGGVNAHVIIESLQQYEKCNREMMNGVGRLDGYEISDREKSTGTSYSNPNGQAEVITCDLTSENGRTNDDAWVNGNVIADGSLLANHDDHLNGQTHANGHTQVNGNHGDAPTEEYVCGRRNGSVKETERPDGNELTEDRTQIGDRPHLLLFSANTETSLHGRIDAYQAYLPICKASLKDIAYTLSLRRDPKSHRTYAVANDKSSWKTLPPEYIQPGSRIAWIFTGQGAQWPEMGAELIDSNRIFQTTVRNLDKFLRGLPTPPCWTIEEELRKVAGTSRVHEAEMGHPLSIAVQVALVDVLRSWGITPDFVVGHSSGEMAAAYASGAITAEAAMAAATFRGTTSGDKSEMKGSMAAIGLGAHEMAPYLESGVVIACENSQCSVTVSGDSEQVGRVIQNVKEKRPGVLARILRVEKAFHSHHMLKYGASYEEHLRPFVQSVSPTTPFYSSVTGKLLTGDGNLGPAYWRKNMESPVLFNTALRSALRSEDGHRLVLIEVGPHPALKGPIGQILRGVERPEDVHLATLQRDKGCEESLLHLAGKMFQNNIGLDFSRICLPGGKLVKNLPRYIWKRENAYWAEPRVAREWRFREHTPHDLLGSRVVEVSSEPCWRNKLVLDDTPWIAGHAVNGQVVFPGAGYICMIGEAIRQLTGESTYSLKQVKMTAGLVLEHRKTVELVTRVTLIATDSSDDSPWHSFSISSFDGSKWTRHCAGEARGSFDESVDLDANEQGPFARKVDEEKWYSILNRVGFNYTGLFRGLQNVSAATDENLAAATVPSRSRTGGSIYAIHPAVIDQCFQLFTVSACRGLGRNCNNIAVPTFIEEVTIRPNAQDLHVTANISNLEQGSFVGDLTATAQNSGSTMMLLRGFKASALTSTGHTDESLPLITQFEWRPSADFIHLKDHMYPRTHIPREWPLFEELMLLCILDHQDNIRLTKETPPHLSKFFSWMQERIENYKAGENIFVSKYLRLEELNSEQRMARIEAIAAEGADSQYPAFCIAMHRLFKNSARIFSGDTHPLHVLMKDDILTEFYAVGDELNYTDALQAIAYTNPRLRILEVGAGTGGTTVKVLKALKSTLGERLYSSYTYTDISAGFMTAAKERFAGVENIEFAALDISRHPAEQGFQLGSYDLIIASNVIHATPSLRESLGHLRSLLRKGGRVFLQELCPNAKFVNYVMGFLSGWWLGDKDNRASEPYVSPDRWAQELVKAGFRQPDDITIDGIAPYQQSAGIFASLDVMISKPSRVSLLTYDIEGPYVQEMQSVLGQLGIEVDICIFGEPLPAGDVFCLLDLHKHTVHELDETSFKILMGYLQSLHGQMLWAIMPSQVACEDPRAAMALGLARTARSELSTKLYTIEIDTATPTPVAASLLTDIFCQAQTPDSDADSMDPDWEYSIVNSEILVPRLHWQTMTDAFMQSDDKDQPPLKYLHVTTPGLLHTMGWSESKRVALSVGEVRVQTRAIGLNFRDVLIALGVLDNSTREIGLEGCGVVTEIGPGVQKLSVGDRVMYMSSGCFTTHITLSQTLCIRIDDDMTFEQGAALPCVFATAMMALVDKANLQRGQTILIHSACGGVGLAAIQIAQMLGAEVYCTVGNEEKRRYLMENHKIPLSRIFNSRDSSFLRNILRATNNKGVDVVLNSLSGDLLHASWKCVAEFGTMIEIGKRDFRRRAKLSMEAFEANRTFVGLDLWQVSQARPEKAAELLRRCVEWIRCGSLTSGVIAKTWEAEQVQEAFRFMQTGRHIGKIIVRMPEESNSLKSTKDRPSASLRSDRSYLLVGGLGGLGKAVAAWMVEQGARHLIFMSRSAKEGSETREFVEELSSQGCNIQLEAGNVSDMADVRRVVESAAKPIAGVINFSMVLKDISLREMTFVDWTTAVEPKVQGTWNLHNAISSKLDFFVLCSSYSGIVGQWGQANYAAANTFLDAFVQYRHHNGLAASVIDIGVMGEVGFVSKNRNILDLFQKSGMRILKEQDLLDAMNLAIQRSRPGQSRMQGGAYRSVGQILLGLVTTVPIAAPNNRVVWKKDMRMSIYHNVNGVTETSAKASTEQDSIIALLASATAEPSVLQDESSTNVIATAIATALANFLIKDEGSIKVDHSPENAGLDSLVAMELRNWIRQKFGVETTVMTIVQSPSLLGLGDHIRLALIERFDK